MIFTDHSPDKGVSNRFAPGRHISGNGGPEAPAPGQIYLRSVVFTFTRRANYKFHTTNRSFN